MDNRKKNNNLKALYLSCTSFNYVDIICPLGHALGRYDIEATMYVRHSVRCNACGRHYNVAACTIKPYRREGKKKVIPHRVSPEFFAMPPMQWHTNTLGGTLTFH